MQLWSRVVGLSGSGEAELVCENWGRCEPDLPGVMVFEYRFCVLALPSVIE